MRATLLLEMAVMVGVQARFLLPFQQLMFHAQGWWSKFAKDRLKNSCLFVHSCWLAAKLSVLFDDDGGGGSVIFVTR